MSTCPLERRAARRYLFLISRLMLARPFKKVAITPAVRVSLNLHENRSRTEEENVRNRDAS